MKILIISTCAEKLHELEFVRPVEDVLRNGDLESVNFCEPSHPSLASASLTNSISQKNSPYIFFTKHYSEISDEDLKKVDKVIICGTSLKDNNYLEDLDKFDWLLDFDKPVLGICAGMQILGGVFGGEIKKKTEIGFYFENSDKTFLGLVEGDTYEVYHLHNNYIYNWKEIGFEVFIQGDCSEHIAQAVKHKTKLFYGVLFHPEVRNKEMILEFVRS